MVASLGVIFLLFSVVLRGELILADFFSGAYIVLI